MSSYVIVWVLLILAWAANFVIRIGFSALLPSIIDELQLSYTRAGLLASAFFYAYVLMQIPSGLLGDRFGRRRVLLIGLVGGALAAGLTRLGGAAGREGTRPHSTHTVRPYALFFVEKKNRYRGSDIHY